MKYAFSALALCLAVVLAAPVATAEPEYRAVSLTLWGGGDGTEHQAPLTGLGDLDLNRLDQSLVNMQAVGIDTVGVNVFWLQDDLTSNSISPDPAGATGFKGTATTEVTTAVIDAIHNRGMNVMLKPLVNMRLADDWRGEIEGTDKWFWGSDEYDQALAPHDGTHSGGPNDPHNGYANYIYHWADIAQQKNVEIFCIGTELEKATGSADDNLRWRAAIGNDGGDGVGGTAGSGIKNRYDGKLTYAANHGGENGVGFWDEMDYLGVDAYYRLTSKNDPTLDELKAEWEDHADDLADWSADNGDKPVLLAEVGYMSKDGTNKEPWNYWSGSDTMDQEEQAACYEALLATLWDNPDVDVDGMFWWNWEIDPDPYGDEDWEKSYTSFTPQGKLAEGVLADYYVPEPATMSLLAIGGLGALLRRRR